jgi:CO dehydrogenase maturation factor
VDALKIAVSGKGGVGKTTLSAMLAGHLGLTGRRVIAVDADPDGNLASALSVPPDRPIVPLAEMGELIAERTGSASGYGSYFRLNPEVSDIPDRYAWRIGPIHLLVLGGVAKGGAGCICPASALLKALLVHLLLHHGDVVVLDMEAGIEHLGRATAQGVNALLVVVDETPWSVQTAQRIRALAGDLGISRVLAVGNRLAPSADLDATANGYAGTPYGNPSANTLQPGRFC